MAWAPWETPRTLVLSRYSQGCKVPEEVRGHAVPVLSSPTSLLEPPPLGGDESPAIASFRAAARLCPEVPGQVLSVAGL